MDKKIIAALGLLASVLCFYLGQIFERRKHTMIIKTNLLIPIEEWLNGAERMNSMLGDTVSAISAGLPNPIIYNYEERRTIQQRMSEGTNNVMGILASKGLYTRINKKLIKILSDNIEQISQILQRELLPLENEVTALGENGIKTTEIRQRIKTVNGRLNLLLFASHSIIAKIKTQYA